MRVDFGDTDAGLLALVLRLCRRIRDAGGTAFIVGGSVRDALLGRAIEEFDLEVFQLEGDVVKRLLAAEHEIDEVGKSFGVLKLRGQPVDVSLPRRESKRGRGHRGFEIHTDPFMKIEDAASRRDFSLNSMLYDPLADTLHDPFHGEQDLHARILRHTSARFTEDPLRVLRGMQLVARYTLRADPSTLELCRRLDPSELARERVFDEWKKLLLLGESISTGLAFLRDTGWIHHFAELEALVGCEQDAEWHPEGDVWTHTLAVMDAFQAERLLDAWEDTVVGFACLCHDFGKPATTTVAEDGRIRSRGHEAAAEAPTRRFLSRLTRQSALVEEVMPLVLHHLKPRQLCQAQAGASAVRRLARKVQRIDRLVRVARADARGRPPKPWDDDGSGDWLLARARSLDLADRAPKPIILGRHLIERGLPPGPDFGPVLERCFEAQLEGVFETLDEGLVHLGEVLQQMGDNLSPK